MSSAAVVAESLTSPYDDVAADAGSVGRSHRRDIIKERERGKTLSAILLRGAISGDSGRDIELGKEKEEAHSVASNAAAAAAAGKEKLSLPMVAHRVRDLI